MRRTLSKKITKGSLLFELGTEEIPVFFLRHGIEQLKEASKNAFMALNVYIDEKAIKVFATPRRFVLYIDKGVSHKQTPVETNVLGPSVQSAYDKDGNPTSAYKGFAKSQGVDLKDVKKTKTPKGEYLYIVKKPALELTANLLPRLLKELILRLEFPKTMRWDITGLRFPRPIRWFLAIYNTKLIKFGLGDITSGNYTFINRNPVKINSMKDYFYKMKKSNILLDPEGRKESIIKQGGNILKRRPLTLEGRRQDLVNWKDKKAEELLDEVTFLTESPTLFLGRFNDRYCKELPQEVLYACLSKYQRLFSIQGTLGNLQQPMPYFFGVVNGTFGREILAHIKKNYEHILEVRLKDALFFYNEDLKIKLDKRVDMLNGIVFLEGLGNMYEKTERLKRLSELIAYESKKLSPSDIENAVRLSTLSKTDLTTLMVREFPSLQGVVGGIYARAQGENDEIADAIRQHYLPKSLGGEVPGQTIACVLSIADRLDTLIGCFGMGLEPTGSEDPYGLKRCANGIISIAINRQWKLSLSLLLSMGMKLFKDKLRLDSVTLSDKLRDYLMIRFEEFCANSFQRDIIRSVTMGWFDDIYTSWQRCYSLNRIRNEDYFKKACKVAERTNNILKGVKDEIGAVDSSKFCEPLERELWKIYEDNRARIEESIEQDKYEDATRFYGDVFFDIIHRFFDEVLVNVEDEMLRRNRLSLMKAIRNLYTQKVADLSYVVCCIQGSNRC